MYHVECIDIRKGHPMFEYCDSITAWSKNMYNVANYHIRNVMTGLKKSPEERTANEEEVLKTVFDALKAVNSKRVSKGKKPFELPTPEKWFLNYYALNAVFKEINNIDYRSGPVHTMQNSIRDCCEAWNGYFSALKAYQSNPEQFTGKPKIPGYVKSPHRVAVISNQESTVKLDSLSFPKATRRFNVSALPHASTDKLIEIRINPYFDLYQIQIVTDDGIPEQSLEDITVKDGACMIDFGLENFAAIVDNKGNAPIVIKGGAIKSVNQFYNKERAKLRSILMKGHDLCRNLLEEEYAAFIPTDSLYLLSNRDCFWGSAALFYPGLLGKLCELLNGSFFVLPSSVHEVLLLPESDGDPQRLADIICNANRTVVSEDDYLSDDLFICRSGRLRRISFSRTFPESANLPC